MRYSRPSAEDALTAIAAAGLRRIVTLTLFPHYSKATTGSSLREFNRVISSAAWQRFGFQVTHIDRYAADPAYLDAMAHAVNGAWMSIPSERRTRAVVVFSAHGLPQKFIDEGDPYVGDINATRWGILKRLRIENRQVLAYQSRTGPVKWLGPRTEDTLVELGRDGVKDVLIVPLSFVSDHIETMYEVDLLFARAARDAGITGYTGACVEHRAALHSCAGRTDRTAPCRDDASPRHRGRGGPDSADGSAGVSRVVIVGAGVAGLAVAHAIRRQAPHIDVVVLEAHDRAGGHVRSDLVDGYLCESGPGGFLDSAPATLAVVREIGLSDRLVRSSDLARRRFIFHRGTLHAVPMSLPSFAITRLLSTRGKLRVAMEPFARRRPARDESIYGFASRRIGHEAARVIVGSMVSGIFAGDAHALSLRSCFPRMWTMETEYGSLMRAQVARRGTPRRDGAVGSPAGTLTSFTGGMEDLVRALVRSLGDCVRTNAPATALSEPPAVPSPAAARPFTVAAGGQAIDADVVVLAGAASASAQLVQRWDPALARVMSSISTAPVAVVCLGYDDTALTADRGALNGFGVLVPHVADSVSEAGGCPRILGVLWETSIYSGRAPHGKALLRVILGGAMDPDAVDLDDAPLLRLVCADLRQTMRLTIAPELVRITRHRHGIPQYRIGHRRRVAQLETLLQRHPGLFAAGSSYSGVALNACIEEAPRTATRVVEYLRNHS